MKTTILLLLSVVVSFLPKEVNACGHCAGDKAASVYSYESKKIAEDTGDQYVVAEFRGINDEETFTKTLKKVEKMKGVRKVPFVSEFSYRAFSFVLAKNHDFKKFRSDFQAKNPGLDVWWVKEKEEVKQE